MSKPQFFIKINSLSYTFANGAALFQNLQTTFEQEKIGLIGRNGVGKSTLLKLITSELSCESGSIERHGSLSYCPQIYPYDKTTTVASALGIDKTLQAINNIVAGVVNADDFELADDNWDIEQQANNWLNRFQLNHLSLDDSLEQLSGGEKTRLLLTRAFLQKNDFILLDEPTNNLDQASRQSLYKAIAESERGFIIVSHDRTLLNLMDKIAELSSLGLKFHGGNYDFYQQQKATEQQAAEHELQTSQLILNKAEKLAQTRKERHQQNISKGLKAKKAQIRAKGSYDKIAFNSAKGRSEKTNKRIRDQSQRKLSVIANRLQQARDNLEITRSLDINLDSTAIAEDKLILEIDNLCFYFDKDRPLLTNFNLKLQGTQRIAIKGCNGSGKSTLMKLICRQLKPISGTVEVYTEQIAYLDQQCTLLDDNLSVLQNFERCNPQITTRDAYFILAKFLFRNQAAEKPVQQLSGGEKLRAALACCLMSQNPPQLLILDEPTNHLDLASIESIEAALNAYQGAMIVISHDEVFLRNIAVDEVISVGLM